MNRPFQHLDSSRIRRLLGGLTVVVLAIGLITGCGAPNDAPLAGAPTPAANLGPTVVGTPALPTLAPRVTSTAGIASTSASPSSTLQPLVDAITAALADPERVPPNVEVTQKATAGNQVKVSWIVSTNPTDPKAKDNVRIDALKILTVVKASNMAYGSVLLAATGTILQEGKRKVTVVVRAKFTQPLVLGTDWTTVPSDTIFTLCDDKPAVIAPAFS